MNNEILGKKIIFPSDITVMSYFRDSTFIFNGYHSGYAIVSYIDTLQCISCDLRLYEWTRFIKEANEISKENISCFLLFQHKSMVDIFYLLHKNHFLHPVYVDKNDSFHIVNRISTDKQMQTFLIDKDDNIIAYGNPVDNLEVKRKYLNMIHQ